MDIRNKTILITGSTGGIGSLLCKILQERGARLILTCYSLELLTKLKAELGGEPVMVPADISSAEGRQELVSACQENGGIDAVVNLAGILEFKLYEDQSLQMIEKILNINLVATMLLCHGLIPILRKKPESALLNVGSIFASIGHPGFTAYCASKAGVKCFTEALSRELADTSIEVSYIAPRATGTSLNSDVVNELNKALGNKSDSPAYVAGEIADLLQSGQRIKYLGWPEKLFVRVNALFPGIVSNSLVKNLGVIKRFAKQ